MDTQTDFNIEFDVVLIAVLMRKKKLYKNDDTDGIDFVHKLCFR